MTDDQLHSYMEAALALNRLHLDPERKDEVARQLALLHSMAQIVHSRPLEAEVEPANVFRP